jgi:thymidylate synthase (FAD)
MESPLVDYFALCPPKTHKVLDQGFVRLVDMMPRMVPPDRTPDFAVIRNARVSLGLGLDTKQKDSALLRMLYVSRHTTPFESVVFTFHLRMPRFVATHFHRHRTASINEFSQRYAKVEENSFFHPSQVEGSLRLQSKLNAQVSDIQADDEEAKKIMREMEATSEEIFEHYKSLLDRGIGKEVARSLLPLATYTEMYYTMNLHNLLHLLKLRYDAHTQKETRDYAEAIYHILRDMVPETMALFDEVMLEGIHLSAKEIDAIRNKEEPQGLGRNEKAAFEKKKKLLGI